MSGTSGSAEASDLLQAGSPSCKASEVVVLTSRGAMSTVSGSHPVENRSFEALLHVTDSELQTLSNRGHHPKVKILPRSAAAVARPISVGSQMQATTQVVHQIHVPETLPAEQETNGKRLPPKKSKHTCQYCGRVCAKPSVLEKHIRSHTNERPFPCQQCGFRFKTRSNLYKHQRSTSHQQRIPGSTETASVSVDSSVEESFDSLPEPDLSETGNEEDQIIHDVEMVPSADILGASRAPLTLVDNDGNHIRTLLRDDDTVGVTVEYTRTDALMRSSSLDRQTITTEMFSNRVDELISHNSKLLDKNIAPLQRRRLSRQSSDGKVDSPRVILPAGPGMIASGSRTLSRQNSSLDTPGEDSVFHAVSPPSGTVPVIRFSGVTPAGVQIIPVTRSQPGTPILLSPNQNVLKVATPTTQPANVPILISPTKQILPVSLSGEGGKASMKEKLKGHLLSRRLQRLQRESSTDSRYEGETSSGRRTLSRQLSLDNDDVILTSLPSQESHDEVFVVVKDETPVQETVRIVQTPLAAENVQLIKADAAMDEDVIIIPETPQPLLLLPTNESLQVIIPGEPSLATNEIGAWQNVNVVQSEPTTPVVINMIDEVPDIDVQQLLLGHKYPSLRISTVATFCTVLSLQPVYAAQSHGQVSMYSKWRTATFNQNPLGLSSGDCIALYRSSWRSRQFSIAGKDCALKITQSTVNEEYKLPRVSAVVAPSTVKQQNKFVKSASIDDPVSNRKANRPGELRRTLSETPMKPKGVEIFPGCIRSDEMYQYVRGRGRGRYVCLRCGIRCRKPSLLKKHFRAHTDLRPYTCHACRFSFKTKGNLTKHMKSRYHSRKCHELGILPVPTQVDESQIDMFMLQQQMKRGTSQDDDDADDAEDDDLDEEINVDVEDEEAAAGLERQLVTRADSCSPIERPSPSQSTPPAEARSRYSPSSDKGHTSSERPPLLGDIMLGTDSRLSTVYGLSCEILANESNLTETLALPNQAQSELQSAQAERMECVSQSSQNEAAHSLLDLASRKDASSSAIGQKKDSGSKTDMLIGPHPESIIRQESAPAGLIQPGNGKGKRREGKTQIPTRLGTIYSSPPSPQRQAKEKSDTDTLKAGFVPPVVVLGEKPGFSKALSLDMAKVNAYSAKRRNPTIVEVSPGGDVRTLLTSSPSPEIRVSPEPHPTSSAAVTETSKPEPPLQTVVVTSAEVKAKPTSPEPLKKRPPTIVKASTVNVPVARTLPQVSGRSVLPRDNKRLLKSTQSVQELIRRLSSTDSMEEPHTSDVGAKRPGTPPRSSDSLAKRPRLAEILSEDSSSRDSPRSSVDGEPVAKHRPANLVVQSPQITPMASPLQSPLMMPYVLLRGQTPVQAPSSPLVLTQMPNLGMLGQPLLMQQPYIAAPQLSASPRATVAPGTPPLMILSPSLVVDQSGQLTLGGGAQNFVFSPSPLVQSAPMFSTALAEPSSVEISPVEESTFKPMDDTDSSTAPTPERVNSPLLSSTATSVGEALPVEMTPIPGRVTTELRSDDGRYQCQACDKSFTHQHHLTLHKNIHAFVRNYMCHDCGLSFRAAHLLQKHKRSQIHQQKVNDVQLYGQASQDNPRPFSCTDCGVAFRIRGHLAKHMRSKQHQLRSDGESEERTRSVDIRSLSMGDDDAIAEDAPAPKAKLDVGARRRRFASESDSFRRHVSDEDFEEAPATSAFSGGTPALTRSLTTCARPALITANRSLSLDAAKPPPTMAEVVLPNVILTTVASVAGGGAETTATTPGAAKPEVVVYQCVWCQRQFPNKADVEKHTCPVMHVVRNHVCETCDAGFTSQAALDKHKRMHQNDEGLPFVCGYCGQKFSQLGHLKTHVTTRHPASSHRPWQRSPESVV